MASQETLNSPASRNPKGKSPQRPQRENLNPLVQAVSSFLSTLPKLPFHHDFRSELGQLSRLPHRYTIYGPLLLLPPTSFYPIDHGPDIERIPSSPHSSPHFPLNSFLNPSQRTALYEAILSSFNRAGKKITHIAINAPIHQTTTSGTSNTMRAPTSLLPILGDFGPMPSSDSNDRASRSKPTTAHFSKSLWVTDTIAFLARSLKISYTWAPVYTMYSQGNLSEKRRILLGRRALSDEATQVAPGTFHGLDGKTGELDQGLADIAVIDFYIGIGYFAFPYLCRGVGRVWGFDISPWAVEGCRRGAELNGISFQTASLGDDRNLSGKEVEDAAGGVERLVVFHGDNAACPTILSSIRAEAKKRDWKWKKVRHVNLGLLPSSEGAWEGAVEVLDWELGGWVHVHENVAEKDIEAKMKEIVRAFRVLVEKRGRAAVDGMKKDGDGIAKGGSRKAVDCVHVEKVKTYAPGVWHIVFDVRISPWESESGLTDIGKYEDNEDDEKIDEINQEGREADEKRDDEEDEEGQDEIEDEEMNMIKLMDQEADERNEDTEAEDGTVEREDEGADQKEDEAEVKEDDLFQYR